MHISGRSVKLDSSAPVLLSGRTSPFSVPKPATSSRPEKDLLFNPLVGRVGVLIRVKEGNLIVVSESVRHTTNRRPQKSSRMLDAIILKELLRWGTVAAAMRAMILTLACNLIFF